MKRLLATLTAVALLMSFSVAGASGKVINASSEGTCNPSENDNALAGSVSLYGEANFHGYGGDLGWNGLFFCYAQPPSGTPQIADLNTVHADAGENCRGFGSINTGFFADCITSIVVKGKAGKDFCIYNEPNYTGYGLAFIGDGSFSQLPNLYNDRFSSMRWVADGGC